MEDRTCSVPGCTRRYKCKGFCNTHYNRKWAGGDPFGEPYEPFDLGPDSWVGRLRVDLDGPVPEHDPSLGACHIWTGPTYEGYGTISVSGTAWSTHRFSYAMNVGPIPDGLFVCHRCDVKACVNPDHLYVGTHAQNMADAVERQRFHSPSATNHVGDFRAGSATLAPDQVRTIRALLHEGQMLHREIGAMFGVTEKCISQIKSGRTWSHLA